MPINNIKKDRICFFDNSIIDLEKTSATRIWHKPIAKDLIFKFDAPYEDTTSYPHIFKDGDIYRMYYTCAVRNNDEFDVDKKTIICYLESKDGFNWTRPNINKFEINGSKDNNCVFNGPCEFYVFKDTNPNCPKEERYKALNHIPGVRELYYLYSSDGINFSDRIKISEGDNYDTLNTAFYDEKRGEYVAFVRGLHYSDKIVDGEKKTIRYRDVRVKTSKDFRTWSESKILSFDDDEEYELYTPCIFNYYNAPQYMIGFVTRYNETREWNRSFDVLTGREERLRRKELLSRAATALTDCIFMCSKDYFNWQRSSRAFFTPGMENGKNWFYGDCYPSHGSLIQTNNALYGTPEMTFFCNDKTHNGIVSYSLRVDGFASYYADNQEKVIVTKPLIFDGSSLSVNIETSSAGKCYVSLISKDKEIKSYEIVGDDINKKVLFDQDISQFAGSEVILKFQIFDADIYSFKFD